MRTLSFLIILLVVIACKNSAKKNNDQPASETGTTDTAQPVNQMPPVPAIPDTIFSGFGTEPFWAVYVINNNKIVFHPADGPDTEVPFVAATSPGNSIIKYNSASGSTQMELIITKKDCSDGMSEVTHPFEVALTINTKKYSGCGRADQ
ncbi:MAG: hypothetical protein H7Y01_09800 [Ferruginibacter sp.]|nr:hypothetical protein [Chitinophagaceae bacterium]